MEVEEAGEVVMGDVLVVAASGEVVIDVVAVAEATRRGSTDSCSF